MSIVVSDTSPIRAAAVGIPKYKKAWVQRRRYIGSLAEPQTPPSVFSAKATTRNPTKSGRFAGFFFATDSARPYEQIRGHYLLE